MKFIPLIEINELQEKRHHKCGPRCWYAKGKKCSCSCGGKNHGILNRENGKNENGKSNESNGNNKNQSESLFG